MPFTGITLVVDPATIEEILVGKAHTLIKNNLHQRVLGPVVGNGLLTADGDTWRNTRRITAPLFSPRALPSYVEGVSDCCRMMVNRWRLREDPDSPLEISAEMSRLAFEIVSRTLLSGALDNDREQIAAAMARIFGTIGRYGMAVALNLPPFIPTLDTLRAQPAILAYRKITERIVDERLGKIDRTGGDLLDTLLHTRAPRTGASLTRDLICDNIRTFVVAGHETTGNALSWILYLLALHPDTESNVLEELNEAFGDNPPSAQGLGGLAYTRAVVCESLRLYPPVPAIGGKPVHDVELCGRTIKRGTPIVIPTWIVHRHQAIWDEPDYFDPERFLRPGSVKTGRGSFIPFGLGPRVCIGADFAIQTILIALATILPHFRIQPVDASSIRPMAHVTLRPADGLPAFVTPRP